MKTILIADDEPSVRELASRHLQSKGYRVLTAASGAEALSRARETPIDVIVTDLTMPDGGGLDVLTAARSGLRPPEVIMITGEATVDNAVQSLRLGAADFLQKPFVLSDLERAVSKAVERAAGEVGLPAAERLKADILNLVSHELKTPLTPILGFSTALLEDWMGPLNEAQKKALQSIKAGAERLTSTVENLCEMARLRRGTPPLRVDEVELAGVFEELRATWAPRAALKGLRLAFETGELRLLTDRVKLKSILGQLIDNALKFTPSGEVLVWAVPLPEGGTAVIVRDGGVGFDPRAGGLFKEFGQLDASETRSHGGLGAGLSIASKLAGALGATLTASAKPGAGAAFVLRLPLAA